MIYTFCEYFAVFETATYFSHVLFVNPKLLTISDPFMSRDMQKSAPSSAPQTAVELQIILCALLQQLRN